MHAVLPFFFFFSPTAAIFLPFMLALLFKFPEGRCAPLANMMKDCPGCSRSAQHSSPAFFYHQVARSHPPFRRVRRGPCPRPSCAWRWSCPWCRGRPPSRFLCRWTERWRTGSPSSSDSAPPWASAGGLTWRARGPAPLSSPETSWTWAWR